PSAVGVAMAPVTAIAGVYCHHAGGAAGQGESTSGALSQAAAGDPAAHDVPGLAGCRARCAGQGPDSPGAGALVGSRNLLCDRDADALLGTAEACPLQATCRGSGPCVSLTVTSAAMLDRKSTRLNSSHVQTSYAALC